MQAHYKDEVYPKASAPQDSVASNISHTRGSCVSSPVTLALPSETEFSNSWAQRPQLPLGEAAAAASLF